MSLLVCVIVPVLDKIRCCWSMIDTVHVLHVFIFVIIIVVGIVGIALGDDDEHIR